MEVALDHHTRISDDENSFGSEVDTDVEDAAEAGLKARKSQQQYSGSAVLGNRELSENTAYLDKYGGAIEDLNIQNVLNSVPYDANKNGGTEIETAITAGREEIMEEEVVELEFEKAIPKLQTHSMHCPNCDHQITKVVLRRKIIKRPAPITEERDDLVGCFSCFSLFTSTDNGGFNPFPIFWNKPAPSAVLATGGNDVVTEDGNCFSIFRVFRKEKDSKQPKTGKADRDFEQPKQEKVDQDSEPKPKIDHPSSPTMEFNGVLNKLPIREGENYRPIVEGGPSKPENQLPTDSVPSHYDQSGVKLHGIDESHIDIPQAISPQTQVPSRGSVGQDSTSFEILKSIVYGGLMEVIASLSIVASAAAVDATTVNIIALALANLIGGIFVIGHNLWDLKDDCYKFSTQETSNQESRNKYKELLGSVEHFPMHVFFAILSFLVFGIIPPVAYGYSFHETNDKDFTMVIVAVASFVCVGLLAIFKAYIDRCAGFSGYVKTITYYLTIAVTVSGVSYVAGNLATRLIEELGLFDTGSNVANAVRLPEVVSVNPSLAYY
ncbi:hypothetical protein L1987_82671 [Smallanthus sonchifolius]|uniref:Uncharacterized protein n=1 Tax=Smallanthus sonchifolius TaxID=185202 RepID=A0ACB8YB19_9ASTR|nr:hypothetical protein L1987_82671 [Smallanthus sonchifolius]